VRMNRAFPVLIILTLLLAGCNARVPSAANPRQTQTGGDPSTIRLGVITMQGTTPSNRVAPITAAFQNQNPNLRVETVPLQYATDAKLSPEAAEAIRAGQVDLVVDGGGLLLPFIQDGTVADLNAYVGASGFDLAPYGPYIDVLRYQGKLVEMPYATDPYLLVYNRSIISSAGVTIPKDLWTWDQFRETVHKLTSGSGDAKVWGFSPFEYAPLTRIWVDEATRPPLNRPTDEAVKESLRYFSTLIFQDLSTPPAPAKGGASGVRFMEVPFFAGKAALALLPLSFLKGQKLPFEWGVAPMPTLPGGKPVCFIATGTLAITAHSPNEKTAWAFLTFAAGPQGALALAKSGTVPIYPSVEAQEAWMQSAGLSAEAHVLFDAGWTGAPWDVSERTMYGLLSKITSRVMSGTNWEDAYQEYAEKAARLTGEKR
jgi:multiple sugar transport system substrate-binding protein